MNTDLLNSYSIEFERHKENLLVNSELVLYFMWTASLTNKQSHFSFSGYFNLN